MRLSTSLRQTLRRNLTGAGCLRLLRSPIGSLRPLTHRPTVLRLKNPVHVNSSGHHERRVRSSVTVRRHLRFKRNPLFGANGCFSKRRSSPLTIAT